MKNLDKVSPRPWSLRTSFTETLGNRVVWIVDARGEIVLDACLDDENGRTYADYKYIVKCVNDRW